MSVGQVAYIIECVPTGYPFSSSPCQTIGGAGYQPVMVQAYIVDPAKSTVFEQTLDPFDTTAGAILFVFMMTMVLGSYLVAKHAGMILTFIRRG